MASRLHPALEVGALLTGIGLLFAGIDWYRHRFVRSDEDLLKLLPGGDATVFYARADLLRRAGMLHLISDTRSEDADYQAFMRETRFDYRKDIDAIAGSASERGTLLAVKGRFDWNRIRVYMQRQGGHCAEEQCLLQGTKQQNWIGMLRIQSDVIGIALGSDKSLLNSIHPGQEAMARPLSQEPVWVKLAPHLLKNPSGLPVALRIFLISLEPANSVIISLAAAPAGSSDAFDIKLNAECPSAVTADTVRRQMELETKMLKLELTHEHQQPNPADLTGLLTAGRFDTSGNKVRGDWPVRKELLKALQ